MVVFNQLVLTAVLKDYSKSNLSNLVVQGESVIFIPKWRLDSQRLIREKQLTLRRLKALMDIVSENDDMKADAEIIHEKYKFKLASLDEMESEIKSKLEERLIELDDTNEICKNVIV